MAQLWLRLHPAALPAGIGVLIVVAVAAAQMPLRASHQTATVVSYGGRLSRRGTTVWLVARTPERTVRASWIGNTFCRVGGKVVLTKTTALLGARYLATSSSCLP